MSAILSAGALPAHAGLLLLDARERAAYLEGHWPGAVHLDIRRWEALARSAEGHLRENAVWQAEIGRLGIAPGRHVAVYDDGRITEASRAWFILQLHGVPAQVLDGGWPALQRLPGFAAEAGERLPTPVRYAPPEGYRPRVQLVERAELAQRLPAGVQVFDARTEAEYTGRDLRANQRGGHLPGAASLPHARLLAADGTLLPESALARRLGEAGFAREKPIVTHCDAGGRAALAALAAVAAGYRDVSTYYLSFSDWSADAACPVVRE